MLVNIWCQCYQHLVLKLMFAFHTAKDKTFTGHQTSHKTLDLRAYSTQLLCINSLIPMRLHMQIILSDEDIFLEISKKLSSLWLLDRTTELYIYTQTQHECHCCMQVTAKEVELGMPGKHHTYTTIQKFRLLRFPCFLWRHSKIIFVYRKHSKKKRHIVFV